MKKTLSIITIFILIIEVFINYNIVLKSTIYGVNIWLNKVFPFLFIMIIINDTLINLNISKYFKNPSLYVFIMSILSGTPSSAYIAGNLYKNNTINKEYANKTLLFTYFSNPLFLYTILNTIFNSKIIVIRIIIIHYLSNLIIYFFIMNKLKIKTTINNTSSINIPSSIKKSLDINIIVLGTIIFYLIITNIIINIIPFNTYFTVIIKGILEVTQGLDYLNKVNIIYKELFSIIFISFGGLSIHTQVKCLLDEYSLNYKYFFIGRLYQTIIAILLFIIVSLTS